MLECLIPSLGECLGRIRKHGFVGGGVTLGVDFEDPYQAQSLSLSLCPPMCMHLFVSVSVPLYSCCLLSVDQDASTHAPVPVCLSLCYFPHDDHELTLRNTKQGPDSMSSFISCLSYVVSS